MPLHLRKPHNLFGNRLQGTRDFTRAELRIERQRLGSSRRSSAWSSAF
jgi:hypothetical protein